MHVQIWRIRKRNFAALVICLVAVAVVAQPFHYRVMQPTEVLEIARSFVDADTSCGFLDRHGDPLPGSPHPDTQFFLDC